ncbi:hypothetical protein AVEN_7864-1 [Araneus ventricosus]|uniref:Uncharacterized protein n=1 Tax=Araneus ventricosus TaxID=182803 RepID=A0A4Y2MIT9_ARAVE|nr:hypothetical protein AVEN_7864-1 [Araneus ventricosus]
MTVEIVIAACALIHVLWSLFQVFRNFNLYYCVHIIPYAILIRILDNMSKKRKNSDICVQTDFEQIETTKDAHTSTDALACGDMEGNVFDITDSVQLGGWRQSSII